MTARETYDIFISLIDDYEDESVTFAEFSRHINTAMVSVMKDHFYNPNDRSKRNEYHEPRKGFENTQYDIESWRNLVMQIPSESNEVLQTDNRGRLAHSNILGYFPEDVIRDEAGLITDPMERNKPEIFHFNSISRWDGSKYCSVKWKRHNEIEAIEKNPHQRPTDRFPVCVYFKNYIQFYPIGSRAIRLSVTRMPLHFWYDEEDFTATQDPELTDFLMYDVIYRAVTLAGKQIREDRFSQLIQQEEYKQ